MSDELRVRLVKCVKEIDRLIAEESVTEQTHFVNDLAFDSIDEVELVMAVEDEFDIELTDEECDGIRTFGELMALVRDRAVVPA